jgi:hypothetical protein
MNGPRRHFVIVRKRRVVDFLELARLIGAAHKDVRPKNERAAYKLALVAVSEFLKQKGWNPAICLWLAELGSALTDLDHGIVRPLLQAKNTKSLPSSEWRLFAMVSLGMRALTLTDVSREDAADQAFRSVKAIRGIRGGKKTIIRRYDEFRKGRVKNREGAWLYNNYAARLEKIDPAILGEMATEYFKLADFGK